MFHEPGLMSDLSEAKQHVYEGLGTIRHCDWDRSLEEWETEIYKSRTHLVLGKILLASESLLKARIALSDAMWNSIEMDQA